MATLRTGFSALMAKGVLSRGWYSILTGLAMAFVAYEVSSVTDDDAAAPIVAVVLAAVGAWQLAAGLRAEFQRRPKSTDEGS